MINPIRKSCVPFLLTFFITVFLIQNNSVTVFAQIALQGGRGLFRLQDANLVQKGDLFIGGFGSVFMRKQESSSLGLTKDYHLGINATYGLAGNLELSTRFVVYQDDQAHIWGPIGDTEIGFKLRIPLGQEQIVNIGFRNYFIIPTGKNHNLPYEPFSADHFGWSPGAALSLDFSTILYFPLKFYFNAGYIDRNLKDDLFIAQIDQIYFGAGFKYSVKNLIFFWEYYTEQFFNRKEVKFSENYQVSSQGLVFLGPYNLILTLAGDVNVANSTDNTFFKQKKLADWKIWFGISKYIPLRGYLVEMADSRRRENERRETLKKQQIIQNERLAAEKEMKRMQDLLKKQQKEQKKKGN